jgi:hypothetical protein
VYWHNVDLPLEDGDGTRSGYTWYEAQAYCENLATVEGRSLFRLPTADELMSLLELPCNGESCSPVTDRDDLVYQFDEATQDYVLAANTVSNQVVPNDQIFFERDGIYFAEGAYWTSTEIDVDGNIGVSDNDRLKPDGSAEPYEAATSVNLHYGTVNNPLFGKHVRLNARCVYNVRTDQDIFALNDVPVGTLRQQFSVDDTFRISELIWWEDVGSCTNDALAKKVRLAQRKNWVPVNGDVNNCPEGISSELTGDFQVCTDVSVATDQCVYFGCESGRYVKSETFKAEVADYLATGDPVDQTQSPIRCIQ